MRDSATEARVAHNHEAIGSSPIPATRRATRADSPFFVVDGGGETGPRPHRPGRMW